MELRIEMESRILLRMDTILYFSSPSVRGGAHMIFVGAQAEASRLGVHLQFVNRCPTPTLVRDLVRVWHPVGAIVSCGGVWNDLNPKTFGPVPAALIDYESKTEFPCVLSILHDSAHTGLVAAKELLSTGFRNFAFVAQPQRRHWSEVRAMAFEQMVRMHGSQCVAMGSNGRSKYDSVWGRALRSFLRSLPLPCGVFASCDVVGVEVLAAARELGLEVPGQLAVLGVDDNEDLCENAVPPLPSIVPDFQRAGAMAVEAVVNAAKAGGGKARREDDAPGAPLRRASYGDVGVARRASTRPIASHDALAAKALDFIRRKACEGIRPAEVAALFPCSRRMADTRFRKAVGHSIGAEIHAVQLSEMQRLLADPGRQLKAIADICGFGSPGSMRNFFRRETGMSPSDWRKDRQ